ncbi:MAG: hypothetical protein PCFJNLEI_02676 [Verrucomicrobiae bacterium]|nr:hypothetical protein [Verrucomicrobiae bacterium]
MTWAPISASGAGVARIVVVVAFWFCAGTCPAVESVRLVERGMARAQIVVPVKADAQTRQAAELLARCIKESSGATLPIRDEVASTGAVDTVFIHVGRGVYVQSLEKLDLESLDADGFVIRGVDATNIVIAGNTAFGTEFGVTEFLERYLGVRWLMPGAVGEDIPAHATIEVPLESVRSEPVFFSRLFSGLDAEAQVWARRNRMHGRVEFHHNLLRIFPPSQYGKTNPEFYPVRWYGGRYIPPTDQTHGWQPCFTATGSVAVASATILRYFDEHPAATSYSLGVTDSGGHCLCAACRAKDPGTNYLGRRDCSNSYYEWCNAVVAQVLKKYPDKYFGVLAYHEVATPPAQVKLNPRIIPFLTYDRMKWIAPDLRAHGEQLTRDWHRTSPILGWYDYIYGSFYKLPRVYFSQMADYYRFAHANGVKAMYAEAYPNWGEGPKFYIALKLQWDPRQDVNALLTDWYIRAVGKEAAVDLAAYYEHWTDFWTRRILDSDWFTKRGEYLPFKRDTYLRDVTPAELAESRTLLENVVRKAQTKKQKDRAQILLRAFDGYEAAALKFQGRDRQQ